MKEVSNCSYTLVAMSDILNDDDGSAGCDSATSKSPESECRVTAAHVSEPWNMIIDESRPKKGRRRKMPMSRSERKLNRNSNLSYFTESGNFVHRKEFYDFKCPCTKCREPVPVEIRKDIFQKFWALGNYDTQTAFIICSVSEHPIKRKRNRNSTRTFTRVYKLNDQEVCRAMFVRTLQISGGRVNTALKRNRMPCLKSKRGKATGGQMKLSRKSMLSIRQHIASFPTYISHYVRKELDVTYLPERITIPLMHALFKKKHPNEKCSLSTYRKIFITYFNSRRRGTHKDACNICNSLSLKIVEAVDEESRELFKEEKDEHMLYAERNRLVMDSDLQQAAVDETVETLTFDLQKPLPLPRISTDEMYYRRQLTMYNLGIHSGKFNESYCYTWLECEGSRGAQEVGSCLKKYLQEQSSKPYFAKVKTLYIWSNSCGGQNQNIKITLMMKACLDLFPHLETITMRFLLLGHPSLPNGKDFADIETAFKHHPQIYTVEEYQNVMKSCRKKWPMQVRNMNARDFLSTTRLENAISTQQVTSDRLDWLQVRELSMTKDHPFKLYIREDLLHGATKIVNIRKEQSAVCPSTQFYSSKLDLLWPDGKAITIKKKDDLLFIIKAGLITKDAMDLYRKVTSGLVTDEYEEDIDAFNVRELDFEIPEELLDLQIEERIEEELIYEDV